MYSISAADKSRMNHHFHGQREQSAKIICRSDFCHEFSVLIVDLRIDVRKSAIASKICGSEILLLKCVLSQTKIPQIDDDLRP